MFKPMLAAKTDNTSIFNYPFLVSPKIDGIRCLILNGVAVTRSLIPIPNDHIRELLSDKKYEGLDGELVVGDITNLRVFNNTQRAVMKKEGVHDFTFNVFDDFNYKSTFIDRYSNLFERITKTDLSNIKFIKIVIHQEIYTKQELDDYERIYVLKGYEGVMIRSFNGLYKNGKVTLNEGTLLKIKRFLDSECEVLEVFEQFTNNNIKIKDNLGRSKRSSSKLGMVPNNSLGYLRVKDLTSNKIFDIATGFRKKERKEYWLNKDKLIGTIVKYKYFDVGVIDKPRHSTFIGFRNPIDMSN